MSSLHQPATSLRQPATDKLKRDYNTLTDVCQKQCREKGCVEDIIGDEETFRLNMEDVKYKKLVKFLLAITDDHLYF